MVAWGGRNIAVIDIGKNTAHLALRANDGTHIDERSTGADTVETGAEEARVFPHDTEQLWAVMLEVLSVFEAEYGVGAISIRCDAAAASEAFIDGETPVPSSSHYWAWRLTGKLPGATQNLANHDFSSEDEGAALGHITARVAVETGLPADTPVFAAIDPSGELIRASEHRA